MVVIGEVDDVAAGVVEGAGCEACSKSSSPSWANCFSRSSANEVAMSFCDRRA